MLDRISARCARDLVVALSVTVAGMVAGACGRAPTDPHQCSQSTSVSVSSGTEPTFSWSSGCVVTDVIVDQVTPSYQTVWVVDMSNGGAIGSPVQYGRLPNANWREITAPVALVPGRRYRVSMPSSGRLGDRITTIEAEFVP